MASYSMASMPDGIFLLLIFFMVTSTFVSPTALEVDLPKSSEQTAVKKPSTKVYIDKTQQLYASFGEESPQAIQDDQLLAFLQMTQQQDSTQVIALYADESVPYGRIVEVLDMTSRHDSPMETPKKKKTGPTTAELKKQQEEQARIKKEKEQQEKEKNKINNRASNAFNRTGGNSAGHSGSPDGNASTGAVSGVPGHNLGTNYRLTAAHFSCAKSGELQFSITVRKDGAVTSVTYVRGTGEAAGDKNVRRQFEQRTRNLRFTVTGDNAPNEKRGVITWKIK